MKHDIDLKKQSKTPYLDNYQKYLDGKYTAFDVPGHHQGGIITPFDKVFTHIIYEKDISKKADHWNNNWSCADRLYSDFL